MAQSQHIISHNYPFLPIRIEVRGRRYEALALLDTSFQGDVVVPTTLLGDDWGLPDARVSWVLADGGVIDTPVYSGTLEIVGFNPLVSAIVPLGRDYILGRGIIDRFEVSFDHGHTVVVKL
jgi:predicted aspartyl protease